MQGSKKLRRTCIVEGESNRICRGPVASGKAGLQVYSDGVPDSRAGIGSDRKLSDSACQSLERRDVR